MEALHWIVEGLWVEVRGLWRALMVWGLWERLAAFTAVTIAIAAMAADVAILAVVLGNADVLRAIAWISAIATGVVLVLVIFLEEDGDWHLDFLRDTMEAWLWVAWITCPPIACYYLYRLLRRLIAR